MYDNYNYPPGADGPDAPWNQSGEQDPADVEVTISQTLHRTTTIQVTDYIAAEWDDVEDDGEGGICHTRGIDYDFSDSNLQSAYEEQQFTLPELLNILSEYAKADLNNCAPKSGRHKYLERLIQVCGEWEVDETEVVKE